MKDWIVMGSSSRKSLDDEEDLDEVEDSFEENSNEAD